MSEDDDLAGDEEAQAVERAEGGTGAAAGTHLVVQRAGGRNESVRRVGFGDGGHDAFQREAEGLAQAGRPVPDVEDAGGCWCAGSAAGSVGGVRVCVAMGGGKG